MWRFVFEEAGRSKLQTLL